MTGGTEAERSGCAYEGNCRSRDRLAASRYTQGMSVLFVAISKPILYLRRRGIAPSTLSILGTSLVLTALNACSFADPESENQVSAGTIGSSGSTGDEEFPFGEPLTDDAQRDLNPNVDATELSLAGAATAEIGWDLYHALRSGPSKNQNIALSGISIQFAFALLHAAANEKTQTNISESLHFTYADETVHSVLNALSLELGRRELPETDLESALSLRLAFGIWVDQRLEVDPGYPDFAGRHYGASLWKTPIQMDPEGAAKRVNRWVSEQTEGLIPDLVDPPPSPSTKAMLVNAMYFYAPWAEPFNENSTMPGTFFGIDGAEILVNYMSFAKPRFVPLFEDDSLQAMILSYRGHQLELQLVLPRGNQFEAVAQSMTALRMNEIREAMHPENVDLKLPKFGVESKYNLLEPLEEQFGLDRQIALWAFSAEEILRVLHRVVLKIDEMGTEGAAATLVEVGEGDDGSEEELPFTRIVVDRPFLFSIADRATGAVLFSGQITKPE